MVLGVYGEKGNFPLDDFIQKIATNYSIEKTRLEVAVPSGETLRFLKDLRKNLTAAIKNVEHWERMRLLR